jgi:hypothetical protein
MEMKSSGVMNGDDFTKRSGKSSFLGLSFFYAGDLKGYHASRKYF